MRKILIVGAGFCGAVIARELAEKGLSCVVVDEKQHIAGICHTERDHSTGIMIHKYGPHIFHTNNSNVWSYICRFAEMMPYVNRVKANSGGQVYSLPINLHTINQFFGTTFSPSEARAHINRLACFDIDDPQTFEEQALRFVGNDIYQAFLRGYTKKQWGIEPSQLPASILKRLPLRFNYDDNYFSHLFQGIPRYGYTDLVSKILDIQGIELRLGTRSEEVDGDFEHIFYSGPMDRYFNYELGRLGYRTLRFERIEVDGDFQGTAVMNYCDYETPYTRISEHKYFAPWETEKFEKSVAFREYSRACSENDIPFYPIRLVKEKNMLTNYVERADQETGVTFVGRLGTYAYLDMDVTIERALETANIYRELTNAGKTVPSFIHSPN